MNPSAVLPRLRLVPALAALALIATTASAADAPRLLAKYNFEDIPAYVPDWGAGLGSTYKPATGWKTPFKVRLDADNPHSGANALRFELIESAPKEKIVHSPSIKVGPPPADRPGDRKVTVHLYARAVGLADKGAGIRVLERDEKGASIRLLANEKTLAAIPDSPTWIEIAAEGVLHSRTRSITFMLVVNQAEPPATIWIDDVSIELENTGYTR